MNPPNLRDYFERTGTVEIIVEIGTGTRTFDSLNDAVLASSTTISKRLKEGKGLNLIEITHRPTEHGTQKRYELTRAGRQALAWAQKITLDETTQERQRVERQFKEQRKQWVERVIHSKTVLSAYMEATNQTTLEDRLLGEGADNMDENVGFDQDELTQKILESDLVDSYELDSEESGEE